jgi:rod shape-determining protein MreC
MKRFNRKKDISPKYLLLFLSAVCIALIVMSTIRPGMMRGIRSITGNFITPMQRGVNTIGEWIENRMQVFDDVEKLKAENEELKKEVSRYQNEIERNESELSELSELRSLYDLNELYPDYNMTVARVFSSNSSQWFSEFYINKGLNDGVYEDCNVLSDKGLIGIVVESYDNYAKVRAIIDDNSNIIAEIGGNNVLSTVNGSLSNIDSGYLTITNIDKDADIEEGDRVVTSNVSDRYFFGITIGYVKDISMDTNNLTKSAHLIPASDFSDIDDVVVILDRKREVNY